MKVEIVLDVAFEFWTIRHKSLKATPGMKLPINFQRSTHYLGSGLIVKTPPSERSPPFLLGKGRGPRGGTFNCFP